MVAQKVVHGTSSMYENPAEPNLVENRLEAFLVNGLSTPVIVGKRANIQGQPDFASWTMHVTNNNINQTMKVSWLISKASLVYCVLFALTHSLSRLIWR